MYKQISQRIFRPELNTEWQAIVLHSRVTRSSANSTHESCDLEVGQESEPPLQSATERDEWRKKRSPRHRLERRVPCLVTFLRETTGCIGMRSGTTPPALDRKRDFHVRQNVTAALGNAFDPGSCAWNMWISNRADGYTSATQAMWTYSFAMWSDARENNLAPLFTQA